MKVIDVGEYRVWTENKDIKIHRRTTDIFGNVYYIHVYTWADRGPASDTYHEHHAMVAIFDKLRANG